MHSVQKMSIFAAFEFSRQFEFVYNLTQQLTLRADRLATTLKVARKF